MYQVYYLCRNQSEFEVLGNDTFKRCTAYESQDTFKRCAAYESQDTFKHCAAYGVTSQPGQPLPPAQGSGPTSSSQMVEYEQTEHPTLQNHTAIISVQARSPAPSHSPPQELGGDEHLYEPIRVSTAMPTTVPVT